MGPSGGSTSKLSIKEINVNLLTFKIFDEMVPPPFRASLFLLTSQKREKLV